MPKTARGRFRFMLTLGLCVLAVAVFVLMIVPNLAPENIHGFAL